MEKIYIDKNSIIFEAGQKADSVYLIIDGDVGIFWETPITLDPREMSQAVSQDPLKPVCPVTIIFLFLKIFFMLFIVVIHKDEF